MRRHRHINHGTIFAIALIMRLAFVAGFSGPNYFTGISDSYLEAMDNLLTGRGLTTQVNVVPLASPDSEFRYEPFIDRPLGYVFLVLPVYGLWRSAISVQVLHAVLGALSCLLLLGVGRRIVAEKTALRAAWLLALWPLSARFEVTILPDAVMPFFLLLTTWLLLAARERSWDWRWSASTGVALAASITMRPDVIFLPFFLIVAVRLADRRWPSVGGILSGAAMVVLVVGLHTARNYEATGGKIAPLGLGNGISLWEGISQFGDTLGTLYGDHRLAEKEGYATWAYPDGVERDRARMSEAVRIIREHPGFYALHMLKRLPVLLTPDWIMSNRYSPSLAAYLEGSPRATITSYMQTYPLATTSRLVVVLLQWVTLALALMAVSRLRTRPLFWIPFAVIAYYILVHIPTNTEARYFYPAIPFVLILAADAWASLRKAQP